MNPTRDILIIVAILCAFAFVLGRFPDDSQRLSIEIDEATGCEYLVSSAGGVTPRMDSDYMHMGCVDLNGENQ